MRGLELFGYGAAAGVLLHAIFGLAIAAAPPARWVFVAMLIVLTLLSAVYFVARRVLQEFSLALSRPSKVSLALWGLLLVLSLGLLHLDVLLPEPLPDGMYVFKTHTINVKVQHLTSLPADNYIPFAVAEFFLRGISFEKERPILPANEVSNRTILMSLVALPFRVALGAPRDHPQLGTYNYLGRQCARCIETKYGRFLRTVRCRRFGPELVDARRVICFLLQPRRKFRPAPGQRFSISRIRISSPRPFTHGPKHWLDFLSCSPGLPSAVAMGR